MNNRRVWRVELKLRGHWRRRVTQILTPFGIFAGWDSAGSRSMEHSSARNGRFAEEKPTTQLPWETIEGHQSRSFHKRAKRATNGRQGICVSPEQNQKGVANARDTNT